MTNWSWTSLDMFDESYQFVSNWSWTSFDMFDESYQLYQFISYWLLTSLDIFDDLQLLQFTTYLKVAIRSTSWLVAQPRIFWEIWCSNHWSNGRDFTVYAFKIKYPHFRTCFHMFCISVKDNLRQEIQSNSGMKIRSESTAPAVAPTFFKKIMQLSLNYSPSVPSHFGAAVGNTRAIAELELMHKTSALGWPRLWQSTMIS